MGALEENSNENAYMNHMFESLVTSDDDVVGMVAYSLYKLSKRDWIANFSQENGRSPSKDECDEYVKKMMPRDIDRLRVLAEGIMSEYGGVVLADAYSEIREEAREDEIICQIQKQGAFWKQVGTGLFSAFLFALILILLYYILKFLGIPFSFG